MPASARHRSLAAAWTTSLLVAAATLSPGGPVRAAASDRSPLPAPSPSAAASTRSVTSFLRPFTITVPGDEALTIPESARMVIVSPPTPLATGPTGDGQPQPLDWQPRGLAVVAVDDAWIHPCPLGGGPSRVLMRPAPADFLDDMHEIGGLGVAEIIDTEVDGRPALAARLDSSQGRCPRNDFHLHRGLSQWVELAAPARLRVLDVDGIPVLILVWAQDEDALAAWLPEAEAIVDSIDFR